MGDVLASVLREKGINDARDDEAIIRAELIEIAKTIEQCGIADARGGDRALVVFFADEELADAYVKSASEKHERVGTRQADATLVAGDHARLEVDRLRERELRKALCFAEATETFAEMSAKTAIDFQMTRSVWSFCHCAASRRCHAFVTVQCSKGSQVPKPEIGGDDSRRETVRDVPYGRQ